jgi:hypothetical protein
MAVVTITILYRDASAQIPTHPRPAPPRFEPERAELALKITVDESSTNSAQPIFEITLENIGENDVVVNLGEDLGNGNLLRPTHISLFLTDAAGTTRELDYDGKPRDPGGVAGRIDDYLVPIRTQSKYTVKLGLISFWCPKTKEFTIELPVGESEIRAKIVSPGWVYNEGSLTKIWRGSVESPPIKVRRDP